MGSPLQKESLATPFGTFDLCWSEHGIGDQICFRLKLKLGQSFPALSLLEPANDWAFVWRGRDDGFLTLALNALIVVAEADRMKMGRDSTLQWFGGQTFYNEVAEDWGDLRRGLWFLPAVIWKLADDQSILIIQSLNQGRDTRLAMKERLLSVLAQAFESVKNPRPPRPKMLSRIDIPGR